MPPKYVNHQVDLSSLVPRVLEAARLPTNQVIQRCQGGIANHVYQVGADFIVRIGSGSDGKEFGKCRDVLDALEGQVKAPRVVHFDDACENFEFPVMVCSYVEGKPLKMLWPQLSVSQQHHCVAEFLNELDRVHAIDWASIGAFAGQPSWPESAETAVADLLARVRSDATADQGLVDKLERYWHENQHVLSFAAPPVLVHNDANFSNVLFSSDLRLSALIDFDDSMVAPKEVEFWNFISELLDADSHAPSMAEIKTWLLGYYAFDDTRALVRLKLNEIQWYLFAMVKDLSWRSKNTCRREVQLEYEKIFEKDAFQQWFAD